MKLRFEPIFLIHVISQIKFFMGQLVILSCNLLSSFSDLTAGGVSKRRWRADGERERRRFGVGRG